MEIIKKLKKTILLEQSNGYRFYVPKEVYDDEDMTEKDYLDNAIPYSLSFDLILKEVVDFDAIQEQMYAQEIHTLYDVLNNRKKVNSIIKKTINADVIIRNVKG